MTLIKDYPNAQEHAEFRRENPPQEKSGRLRVKDKVALVTGAGSGIGRATALKLAAEGAMVALVDRKEARAEDVKRIIEAEHGMGKAIVTDTDVSDPMRMQDAFRQTIARFGKLDIVFANAGINGVVSPIEQMSEQAWDETLGTNLRSTFLTVKYAIGHMKQNGGSIIITSSVNGNRKFSSFGMSAYATSKAGQLAFGKMAALELARHRIRVNVICPGAIETNIGESTVKTPELANIRIPVYYPQGSKPLENAPGKPEQVADLVLFLASDESSHITGTEIYIDGAESLL
jgi:NAD(P)-dependent dehydrogenase (short-subunit alcohol dehydrogenase family)